MAKVQLANVAVLDNPSPFLNPFQFEVTFECIEELKEGKDMRIFRTMTYKYYYSSVVIYKGETFCSQID